jgi:hypothetical protein
MASVNEKLYRLSEDGQSYEMLPEVAEKYTLSINRQLENWLVGVNEHTKALPEGIDDECCPDMSCCGGKPWPQHVRDLFAASSDEVRYEMCMNGMFGEINKVFDKIDDNLNGPVVHIAGFNVPKESLNG